MKNMGIERLNLTQKRHGSCENKHSRNNKDFRNATDDIEVRLKETGAEGKEVIYGIYPFTCPYGV